MNSSVEAILIIVVLLVILIVVSMVSHNRTERTQFLRKTEKDWGKGRPPKYTDEAFREIRLYSDSVTSDEKTRTTVDDITWTDSDMDRVFQLINRTFSSPGEDVLYSWLRHPLLQNDELKKRDTLITAVGDNPDLRQKMSRILFRVGRDKKGSYYADAFRALKAPKENSGKYIFLCALTIFCIVLLFIRPVAGILVMVADFALNIAVRFKNRNDYRKYIHGFKGLLKILSGAEQLAGLSVPVLTEEESHVREILKEFVGFRRGAFLVTSSGSAGSGVGEVILEYVNLFFHFDMIQFNRMAGEIRGKETEIRELIRYVGTADAAISAASFRAGEGEWCRPLLESEKPGFLEAELLYHPLLDSPVKNDIAAKGGNLITGANASGKSTFLKSVSIGTILAQSICTVPAHSWHASFFRIYTSMALNDNLLKGESYFVVEIRSLKRIMDAARESRIPVLGMIDEVLRGTNTIERIAASAQVLRKLNDGNTLIFAATHDIELTQILKDLYHNYHFSGTVKDRDVRFDYHIKEGPTRERNAIALMAAAGYDPLLAQKAEETARHFEKTGEWKL